MVDGGANSFMFEKHQPFIYYRIVAIGVPLNNAVTLYEYYEASKEILPPILKELLTPNYFKPKDRSLTGMWLQHYKSSIISPGNKPLGKLIGNAFS